VGKTSLGQSIARALGREFVRLSLGGIRDEAEIRGHRRTYIGAMPGRIIQSLRRVGTNNPVFMLDEIDKVTAGFQGDPAAALLEVLDPAQNSAFSDHYIDVPFDLSRVLFIATANILDTIPPPLRDRMEIIELSGYTEHEKLHIARRYLVPRQIAENGLTEKALRIDDDALMRIISDYTREAGVRSLERQIGSIARKVAREVAEGKRRRVTVRAKDVAGFLGPVPFRREVVEEGNEAGVVTGMAWTPVGGDVLFVEASTTPGRGNLTLTGQLGEVMQESARAALTYVRSIASEFGIPPDFYEKTDFHVHVPAGSIPKDGPSAGVTMATALISSLTGRPVDKNVAMTGEVTLRGRVLPIGGVKDKVLAAHRAGVRTVIVPRENEQDLRDIPEDVRNDLRFVLVDHVRDIVPVAMPQVKQSDGKQKRPRRKAS
jgi:ATP-dependent Lon protease